MTVQDYVESKFISFLKDSFPHYYEENNFVELGITSSNFSWEDHTEGTMYWIYLKKSGEKSLQEQFYDYVHNFDPEKRSKEEGNIFTLKEHQEHKEIMLNLLKMQK